LRFLALVLFLWLYLDCSSWRVSDKSCPWVEFSGLEIAAELAVEFVSEETLRWIDYSPGDICAPSQAGGQGLILNSWIINYGEQIKCRYLPEFWLLLILDLQRHVVVSMTRSKFLLCNCVEIYRPIITD
jgi:hypothetical protein